MTITKLRTNLVDAPRGGPTCVHESLQVQCIDVMQSRDNVQAKCTELVVIRARTSDLLGDAPVNLLTVRSNSTM